MTKAKRERRRRRKRRNKKRGNIKRKKKKPKKERVIEVKKIAEEWCYNSNLEMLR